MNIPESVAAYVTDGGIRRATNELLDVGEEAILEGFDWSELERFYRAQFAARQLLSEWAIFGLRIWGAVWGGLLDDWTALAPDDQCAAELDASVSLSSLRNTGDDSLWFGRVFHKGPWTLYASIAAIPSVGIRIRVSAETARKRAQFQDLAPRPDEVGIWEPSESVSLDGERFDPARLRAIAEKAIAIANNETTGART